MRTSAAGIALIKQFEGCRLDAYLCPAGKWTIGYGHTFEAGHPPVNDGDEITQADANRILRDDLRAVEADVLSAVQVQLKQNEFDALVSFTFNLGIGSLQKSTLLRRVNESRKDAVPGELMKWTKARVNGQLVDLPGLVKRRRAEAALWRAVDDSPPEDVQESRATPEPPQPPKTMATSKEGNAAAVAGGGAVLGGADVMLDQVERASGFLPGLLRAIENPKFIAFVVIAGAAAAIWFWRRRRLREEGA